MGTIKGIASDQKLLLETSAVAWIEKAVEMNSHLDFIIADSHGIRKWLFQNQQVRWMYLTVYNKTQKYTNQIDKRSFIAR